MKLFNKKQQDRINQRQELIDTENFKLEVGRLISKYATKDYFVLDTNDISLDNDEFAEMELQYILDRFGFELVAAQMHTFVAIYYFKRCKK